MRLFPGLVGVMFDAENNLKAITFDHDLRIRVKENRQHVYRDETNILGVSFVAEPPDFFLSGEWKWPQNQRFIQREFSPYFTGLLWLVPLSESRPVIATLKKVAAITPWDMVFHGVDWRVVA